MHKNPNPIDLKSKTSLCQYMSGTGHRSVESLRKAFGDFVIVIEAHAGCGDAGIYLEAPAKHGRNGLVQNLWYATKFSTREAAERRAKKIAEPCEVVQVSDVALLGYTCSARDLARAEMDGRKSPNAEALCDARVDFYGRYIDKDGKLRDGVHTDPKSAVAAALTDLRANFAQAKADFALAEKIALRASKVRKPRSKK